MKKFIEYCAGQTNPPRSIAPSAGHRKIDIHHDRHGLRAGAHHASRRIKAASSTLVGLVVETKDAVSRFFLLLQRALRQNVRDRMTNLVRFGIAALLAQILSQLYGRQSDNLTEDSVGDRITIIAQAAIQISMLRLVPPHHSVPL